MGRHSMDNLLSKGAPKLAPSQIALVTVTAFLLQVVLAPNMQIGGIAPNFLLVAMVAIAVMTPSKTATIAGFALGLLFDLLGSGALGCMALVMTVVAYALSALAETFKVEDIVSWLIMFAVCALAVSLAYCIVLSLAGAESDFIGALVFRVLPWTIYNVVMAAALWPLVRKVVAPAKPGALSSRIQL